VTLIDLNLDFKVKVTG